MRKFHIKSIQKYLKDQNDKNKQQQNEGQSLSKQVVGPNIKPSSTYNFKK